MSDETEASEMVTIPKAKYEALRAEVRRLRREKGDRITLERIKADSGPGPGDRIFTREQLAERLGIVD